MGVASLASKARTVYGSLVRGGGRQVVRTLTGLLICTAISQACGLLIVLLAAWQLGQSGLGIFLFALTVQSYLTLIGGAGASQVLVREIGADRSRTDEHITAYAVLVVAMTLAVTGLAATGLLQESRAGDERALMLWMLAGSLAASLNLLPLFDAHHCQARAAVVAVAADLLALGGFALAAQRGQLNLPVAGVLMAMKWTLTFFGQLLLFQLSVRRLHWQLRWRQVRLFATSGLRLLSAYLLLLIPLNGGVILTRLLRTSGETACVGIATQVALVYFLLCWQVTRVIQPHVMGALGMQGWFVRRLALGYGGTIVGLATAVIAAAAGLGYFVLGAEYRDALLPMGFLVLGVLFTAAGLVVGLYLHREKRENAVVAGHLTGCLVYLGLGVWMTWQWGGLGVGIASCLAALAGTALQLLCLRGGKRLGEVDLSGDRIRPSDSPFEPGHTAANEVI